VRDTDKQEDRKPGRKTIAERDGSGHGEQHGKGLPVLAEPIASREMIGPVISRTAVPAANTAPISEG
jgi:hypothetical protein